MNAEEMARSLWPVLVALAPRQKDIFYSDLAALIGTHQRAITFGLDLIQTHCIANDLPPLTVLVVNKQTGEPGAGFNRNYCPYIPVGLQEVANFNWDEEDNPF